jgi:hypothetical protein
MFVEQPKKRGRPKGSGKVKNPAEIPLVVTQNCYDLILSERKPTDRHFSATIERVFREKGHKIRDLQKKVDALLDERHLRREPHEHETYESRPNTIMVEVPNK